MYRGWEREFPVDWEVCFIDAPGRGRLLGRPLINRYDRLVDFFLDELKLPMDRPFAFFGHSMGALIAYELTRRLVKEERPLPVWIGVSSCAAREDTVRPSHGRDKWSDDELRGWLRSVGGTPNRVLDTAFLWRIFGPVLRNDFALVDTWSLNPEATMLPVPLSAFGGTDDKLVGLVKLAAWSKQTRRFSGPHMYIGDHFYLQQHSRAIARCIVQVIRHRDLEVQAPSR